MGKTLTKSGIKFNEMRVSSETTLDPNTGNNVTKWYINVGYKVLTIEGEKYNRDKQIELKGTKLTTVKSFFTTIKNQILSEEGVN